METTESKLWNKKMDELTVKEVIIVNVALPIVVVGGLFTVSAAVGTVSKATNKFREFRTNRQNKVTKE